MYDPRHFSDDDLDDREFPDEPDEDEDDESELVECGHCGAEIYEDSPQCPVCGEYLSASTSAWSGRSWWWIAAGLVGIAAVIYALTRMP
jgi:hypothetical protein